MKKIQLAVLSVLALSLPLSSALRADDAESKAKTVYLTTPVAGPIDAKSGKPALDFKAGTELWLEGNSTVHRFYFNATQVSATSEVDKSDPKDKSLLSLILDRKIHNLTVTVPIAGLKSGEDGMDKNAANTLKAKDFPDIVFKMNDYVVKPFPGTPGVYAILAQGKMKIAGQERDIVLEATLLNGPEGLVLYGNQDILQKDYGVSPYSMALVMNVDNKIVVHYVIKLGIQETGN